MATNIFFCRKEKLTFLMGPTLLLPLKRLATNLTGKLGCDTGEYKDMAYETSNLWPQRLADEGALSRLCEQISKWTNEATVPVRIPSLSDKVLLCTASPSDAVRPHVADRYDGNDKDESSKDLADEFYDFASKFCHLDEEKAEEDNCAHGSTEDQLYRMVTRVTRDLPFNYEYGQAEFLASLGSDQSARFQSLLCQVHYHDLDEAYDQHTLAERVRPLFLETCSQEDCYYRSVRLDENNGNGRPCDRAGPLALPATMYRLASVPPSRSRVVCQLELLLDLHRLLFMEQTIDQMCLLCLTGKHNQRVASLLNGEARNKGTEQFFSFANLKLPAWGTSISHQVGSPFACGSWPSGQTVKTLRPFMRMTTYKLDEIISSLRIRDNGSVSIRNTMVPNT